jgi:hypothetical protein
MMYSLVAKIYLISHRPVLALQAGTLVLLTVLLAAGLEGVSGIWCWPLWPLWECALHIV